MCERSERSASELIDQLPRRGTVVRIRALAELIKSGELMTHRHLAEVMGRVDSVTLYRTLEWLVLNGLAKKVIGFDRTWRYRASVADSPKHGVALFECVKCGSLAEIAAPKISLSDMKLPIGFEVAQLNINMRGICSQCSVIGIAEQIEFAQE